VGIKRVYIVIEFFEHGVKSEQKRKSDVVEISRKIWMLKNLALNFLWRI
jgi:hypothetical protein